MKPALRRYIVKGAGGLAAFLWVKGQIERDSFVATREYC